MNRLFKVLAWLVGVVLIVLVGGLAFLNFTFPKVSPAPELSFEYTSERIERGAYLANHVTVCMDCHSARDFSEFSGPPTPGTLGKGGDRFDHGMGLPGTFYAKNITPFGISDYSDGELYRLITTGVTNENRVMFPLMPYRYYGGMDPEDIYDIIAYIRSLKPIEFEVPESKADFPVSLIMKTIPQDPQPMVKPSPEDQVAYGKYLVNAAGCVECHTPVDAQGMVVAELAFSGGRDFPFPGGAVVSSSNISTDKQTGIGNWSEEMFVQRFKQYTDSTYVNPKVNPGEFNTIMPWLMYAGMKEADLKAIYAYLQTLPAHSNSVVKFTTGTQQ